MHSDFGTITIFAQNCETIIDSRETVSVKKRNESTTYVQEEPFEEVYSEHLQRVVSFAYYYLNDMQEARNVAHDVFISYWHAVERGTQPESVLPYLLSSTKNRCLNIIRKNNSAKKYSSTSMQRQVNQLNHITMEDHFPQQLYTSEIEKHFHNAVEMMKPKVRRTFILSRINGLKNREIALIEGVAESTIEARISSALMILRRVLKDYIK